MTQGPNITEVSASASGQSVRRRSLGDLLREAQWSTTTAVDEFVRLATGAHARRRQDEVADRDQVNRSTALWAALVTDPEVALAAAEGLLTEPTLKEQIRITAEPAELTQAGATPDDLVLDGFFDEALASYVASGAAEPVLDVAGIVTAILVSTQQQGGGMLPGRLSGVDAAAALDGLVRLRAGHGAYGLSRSVRAARRTFETQPEVAAADIVMTLMGLHNYAEGALASVIGQQPREARGERHPVDVWLGRARSGFDSAEVLASEKGIVDGELVILGLSQADPALRAALNADPASRAWLDGIRPTLAQERGTEPSIDVPATEDLLGRDVLAKAIVQHLDVIGERGEASLLIHLDGVWGAGKSSVLGFVKKEMGDRYLVVDVNAWREQCVGAQWWTLYQALKEAYIARAPWWRRWFVRSQLAWDVVQIRRDRLWTYALGVVAAGLFLGSVAILGFDTDVLKTWVAGIATGIAAITGLAKFLSPTSPRAAEELMETSTNPMNEVSKLFRRSLERSRQPVVFCIDDLDRCDVGYVIRFLEVVQTLIRIWPDDHFERRGPYAIVAAEGAWLRRCYQQAYADLADNAVPGKPLGHRFLEKLFQMHIRLPTIEDDTKRRYYESLLFPQRRRTENGAADAVKVRDLRRQISSSSSTQDITQLSEDIASVVDPVQRHQLRSEAVEHLTSEQAQTQRLHELMPFGDLLDPNPRTIRLFVNAVSIQTYLRLLEGVAVDRAHLALWAVLEARWPALADHLRDHPEDVGLVDGAARDGVPDELKALLASAEVGAVLRSERWQPFDVPSVRACTGTSAPSRSP